MSNSFANTAEAPGGELARLHLEKFGAKLTTLTQKQANYNCVPVEGPYNLETYRY